MAKESLHPISGSNCIFRETLNSALAVARNGGVATDVSFANGIGTFNGSSSEINYGNTNKIASLTDSFSVEARFRNNSGSNDRIFARRDGGGTHFEIFIADGTNKLALYNGSSLYIGATENLNNNQWYHVVIVINGASSQFYINGSIDGSAFNPSISRYDTDTKIGNNIGGTSFFIGDIDYVNIYNKALTAEEVANLYAKKHHAGLVQDGLVGYWDFMRGSSYDWSGNGNDGTDTDIVYAHGLGAQFNNGTAKIEVGNLSVILKTIIIVAKLETTTEELIDLDGTNKMDVTAGTLACGGLITEYVNGIIATAVGNALNTFMAVTDATGVSATDFDIGEANFDGRISAIVAYTLQLSAAEIAQNYQYCKTRFNL